MNRIKALRQSRNITLDQVSDKAGINRATLSRYENGNSEPKAETWYKLAQYFDVTIGYLMGYEEMDSDLFFMDEAMAKTIRDLLEMADVKVMLVKDGKPILSNETGLVEAYLHPELIKVTEQ